MRLCAAFNMSYTTALSHNCLYGWPGVVSAPIQRFIALSVQLCGDYATHRGTLYLHAASGLSVVTVVDSCFCDSCTVERLSQGRPRRGPAKGCEGNWLFSYHSRHSAHILLLLQGPVALMHLSQESLTSSQPHIAFSFVFNIN